MTRSSNLFLLILLAVLAACRGGGAPERSAPKKPARAAAPEAWMELRRGTEPQELVRIGIQGAVIGPAGGRATVQLFAGPRRSDVAWYFLRTYAPFELKSPQGNLVFHSKGRVTAGPVEKRMIFEWARSVAAEGADSRVSDAYGLVLAWHQGGSSGICRDVALYLTGDAKASACGWDKNIEGRLDSAALPQVYDWFDRLKSFQAAAGDRDMRQGSLETRLVFAGNGTRQAGASEQGGIQAFGAALFSELAARREGAAPAPAPSSAPQPTKPPSPVPPSPSRLLLPLHPTLVKTNDEIVLQLPDQPPPPPPGMGMSPRPRPRPAPTPEDSAPPG